MAFIYHKENKVLTECLNEDVIKLAKKEPEAYIVNEDEGKIKKIIQIEEENDNLSDDTKEEKDFAKMKVEDLRVIAKVKGIHGCEALKKEELLKILEGNA